MTDNAQNAQAVREKCIAEGMPRAADALIAKGYVAANLTPANIAAASWDRAIEAVNSRTVIGSVG